VTARGAAALAAVLAALAAPGCGGGQQPAGRGPASGAGPAAPPTAPKHRPVGGRPGAYRHVHVAPSHEAVPVLMYHVIGTRRPGTPLPGLWVTPAAFRAQMDALARAGFTGVTLDRVLDAWAGRATLPRHAVVVSFDDGYFGQGHAAATTLRALRWPGVLNLVWKNLGTPGGLTAGRVRDLIAAGWEIDAHTLHHLDLTTLASAALRREIAGSRQALRRRFGVVADGFCYPAGRFDAAVEAAVRAAGFRAATTELPGAARPSQDHLALPRVRVDGGESTAQVLRAVNAALGSAT
jgi:peptidoglycan/xylan/chitin deacetylase (PgdA/CDA1 family)